MKPQLALLYHMTILVMSPVLCNGSPVGCTFDPGLNKATCDYGSWSPPLRDSQFSSGNVYDLVVQNVNGNIPAQAVIGLAGPSGSSNGGNLAITFQCNLEDIILADNTFTSNLDWIKTLTFQNCYIRDGIPGNMLANLSGLETLNIYSGIVGPLSDLSFAGLTNLKALVINSDFLDRTLPPGLFSVLKSVNKIDLRLSGITSLSHGSFHGLTGLRTLDLSANSLTSLPAGLFTSLSQLTTVILTANNWECTCDMAWISTWSLYTDIKLDVVCATPSSYSGLTLSRALMSQGCSNMVGSEVQDSSLSPNAEDTTRHYAYAALAMAGLSCILSGILACILVFMNTKAKTHYPVSPNYARYHSAGQQKPSPISAISRAESRRPVSYRSAERLFVPSPTVSPRIKDGPYIDVDYRTDF